jgi:hypothetical protein
LGFGGTIVRASTNAQFTISVLFLAVEQLSRPQQEFINMEMLNEQLPRPGEPGAPCLPSHITPYPPLLNGKYTASVLLFILIIFIQQDTYTTKCVFQWDPA